MSKPTTDGINDPALYEKMVAPFPDEDAANDALRQFSAALRKLRAKHRIADVAFIASVVHATDSGTLRVATSGYNGDVTLEAELYAWGLGKAQAARESRLRAITARARGIEAK